jgi:hypothetical protein
VDLLHLTGALPQRSFDNITRGIEQLNDLLGEIDGRPAWSRCRRSMGTRRRRDGRARLEKIS